MILPTEGRSPCRSAFCSAAATSSAWIPSSATSTAATSSIEDDRIAAVGPALDAGDAEVDRRARTASSSPASSTRTGTRGRPSSAGSRPTSASAATSTSCSTSSRRLPARGRLRRQLPRLARGDRRRRDDAPRLVAHQQHARARRRGDPRPRRTRGCAPSTATATRTPRSPTGGTTSDARVARGHPPRPRPVLLERRRADHARDGHARAGLLHARGREARLGARARRRRADQRPRRHGPVRRPLLDGLAAERHGPARAGHDVHPLQLPLRRGVPADRRHGREGLDRSRRSR